MEELDKFGQIENLEVLENLGDHMFGNVYVKYSSEEEAEKVFYVVLMFAVPARIKWSLLRWTSVIDRVFACHCFP